MLDITTTIRRVTWRGRSRLRLRLRLRFGWRLWLIRCHGYSSGMKNELAGISFCTSNWYL